MKIIDILNKIANKEFDNLPKTIFKYKTKDGKEFYSLGLSKKKQDGSYENGFISCRFKKDTQLENKTRISRPMSANVTKFMRSEHE